MPDRVSLRSPLPKYEMLAQLLRHEIVTGRLPAGAQLPTEEMLVRQHGVARETVRRAIGLLEAEGLVRRAQGSGSFVNAPHPDAAAFRFVEPPVTAAAAYRLLRREIAPATLEQAALLKVTAGTPVVHVVQVTLEDGGRPVACAERMLPESLCPALVAADLTRRSVHDVLHDEAAAPPTRAVLDVEARTLTDEEAERLDATPGTAGLIVTRLTYTAPNRPAVWYRGLFRDHCTMAMQIALSGPATSPPSHTERPTTR